MEQQHANYLLLLSLYLDQFNSNHGENSNFKANSANFNKRSPTMKSTPVTKKASNTVYICDQCGNESVQWLGKCPHCNAWNSFKEFKIMKEKSSISSSISGGGINHMDGWCCKPHSWIRIEGLKWIIAYPVPWTTFDRAL